MLVIILRSLQNLDPVWEPGTVIVIGALSGAGAFVTALGLFDPRKLFEGEAGLPRATWMGIVGFLLGLRRNTFSLSRRILLPSQAPMAKHPLPS